MIKEILTGHNSPETAYLVENYPYGRQTKTKKFYWVETDERRGDRVTSYTLDPWTGKPNKVKHTLYSPFMFLYLNEIDHVLERGFRFVDIKKINEQFTFIIERIGVANVNDLQQRNIRKQYIALLSGEAAFQNVHCPPETRQQMVGKLSDAMAYIKKCSFEEMLKHPAKFLPQLPGLPIQK